MTTDRHRHRARMESAAPQLLSRHSKPRRADIQGLRAIAVLMVVVFHAGLPLPGGFVGVDVFFVISGFVITAMLIRESKTTGRINFMQFYVRRFKRLTPALAFMTAITVIGSAIFLSPLGSQQTAAATGVGALLFVANVVIARTTGGYFDADAEANPLLHTWSLSVEEQFYFVFPALLALGWLIARRSKLSRHAATLILAAVAAISFGLACLGPSIVQEQTWLFAGPFSSFAQAAVGFYSPLTRSWEFAAGALLATVAAGRTIDWDRLAPFLSAAGVGLLIASAYVISASTSFPSAWTLLPVFGTLLVIAAGCGRGPSVLISRIISSGPLVRVGDWSYSLYLWHWPFIVFARSLWPESSEVLPLAACLSVIPAMASYYWIETPIRDMKRVGRKWMTLMVLSVFCVPLLLSSSLLMVAGQGFWSPGVLAMQNAVLTPHVMSSECAASNISNGVDARCRWNSTSAGQPMYLVGDSTAWHFSEAAVGASSSLDRPLTAVDVPGCPFKDVYIRTPDMPLDRNTDSCRKLYVNAVTWLAGQPAGTVIISQLNSTYRQRDAAVGANPQDLETSEAGRAEALDRGLVATIDTLKKAGHSVLLVQAAPDFSYPKRFDPLHCTIGQLRRSSCKSTMSREDADAVQAIERSALQRVAIRTGSKLWDPRAFFCPNNECSTYQYGVDLYRDAIHISPAASKMLAPSLAAALNAPSG